MGTGPNAARMDYPRFVAFRWPAGSGAVESVCKCLVEVRLKQSGMSWCVPDSQAIASFRALHRSGRWAPSGGHIPTGIGHPRKAPPPQSAGGHRPRRAAPRTHASLASTHHHAESV